MLLQFHRQACTYIYICVQISICTYTQIYTHIYTQIHTHKNIFTHTCTNIHEYTRIYIDTYITTYLPTYIHTYIYTYIHMYIVRCECIPVVAISSLWPFARPTSWHEYFQPCASIGKLSALGWEGCNDGYSWCPN